MSQIKSVAIILKPKVVNELYNILPNLCEWLKRRKVEFYFDEKCSERITKIFRDPKRKFNFETKAQLLKSHDLIITLGGDGTLIGVARKTPATSTPIFGINMGNLGFITEFSKQDFYDDLEEVLKGNFDIRKVPLYKTEIYNGNELARSAFFVNDAVI